MQHVVSKLSGAGCMVMFVVASFGFSAQAAETQLAKSRAERVKQMIGASIDGNAEKVRSLLETDPALVNVRDAYLESTPLIYASHRGYLAIVQMLLTAGAAVDGREGASNTTALHWAADAGHVAVAKLLVAHGADREATDDWFGLTPLGWATVSEYAPKMGGKNNRPVTVAYLLSQDVRMDIFVAVALRRADVVRHLVAADPGVLAKRLGFVARGQQPLHVAVSKNLTDMVELLVNLGADPAGQDAWGLTPMATAILAKHEPLVNLFKARGVSVDLSAALAASDLNRARSILSTEPELVSRQGRDHSLLHFTAWEGLAAEADLLLEHGAKVGSTTRLLFGELPTSMTPLHQAAWRGHVDVVRSLFRSGAPVQVRCTGHWDLTALHLAAHAGHVDVVRVLLDHGADMHATVSRDNMTPLALAEKSGQEQVVSLLKKHGALKKDR